MRPIWSRGSGGSLLSVCGMRNERPHFGRSMPPPPRQLRRRRRPRHLRYRTRGSTTTTNCATCQRVLEWEEDSALPHAARPLSRATRLTCGGAVRATSADASSCTSSRWWPGRPAAGALRELTLDHVIAILNVSGCDDETAV